MQTSRLANKAIESPNEAVAEEVRKNYGMDHSETDPKAEENHLNNLKNAKLMIYLITIFY